MTLLVSATVHHALVALEALVRLVGEAPGVVFVPDKGEQQPLVALVEVLAVVEAGVAGELVLGEVDLLPALVAGRVQQEDEGEGGRQHRAVVKVLPPQTCPAKIDCFKQSRFDAALKDREKLLRLQSLLLNYTVTEK